jgi:hypothetical protein
MVHYQQFKQQNFFILRKDGKHVDILKIDRKQIKYYVLS